MFFNFLALNRNKQPPPKIPNFFAFCFKRQFSFNFAATFVESKTNFINFYFPTFVCAPFASMVYQMNVPSDRKRYKCCLQQTPQDNTRHFLQTFILLFARQPTKDNFTWQQLSKVVRSKRETPISRLLCQLVWSYLLPSLSSKQTGKVVSLAAIFLESGTNFIKCLNLLHFSKSRRSICRLDWCVCTNNKHLLSYTVYICFKEESANFTSTIWPG